MNPENHRPRIRLVTRVLVPGLILGVTAALIAYTSWRTFERLPEAAVSPVAIVASASAPRGAEGGLQAPGWIEPAPFATEVRALREGVVTEVLALEGAQVAMGDVLATLDRGAESIALARREAEVRLADAQVVTAQAAVDAAERTLSLTLEADRMVRDAQSALSEAEAMRAKLDADIAEAEATASEARDEHERKLRLVESGSASAGEARRLGIRVTALSAKVDSLRAERAARDARIVAARGNAESARLARNELVAEKRAHAEARAALDSAHAARAAAAAMRDEAQLALTRSEIRAPRNATVMRRIATPGARVGGDADALFLLYDPAALQVRCDVPLKDAGKLAPGLTADVAVDALPGKTFRGTVARIVPQGDIQKNTVQCKITILAPDPALSPDMLARVRIHASAGPTGSTAQGEAVAVPAKALRQREGSRAVVLVAQPDGAAARTIARAVTLGDDRGDGWFEVIDGLAAGDRVVLDEAIAEGTRIAPVESTTEDRS